MSYLVVLNLVAFVGYLVMQLLMRYLVMR
jgi:hypothetical protein